MTLSLCHFLYFILFGVFINFQVCASDIETDEDFIPHNTHWLQIDIDELEDARSDRRRLSWWADAYDTGADIIKILGRLTVFSGGILTFVSSTVPEEVRFGWTLASGIVTTAGGGLIVMGDKAEAASQTKRNEVKDLTNRIRVLETKQFEQGDNLI